MLQEQSSIFVMCGLPGSGKTTYSRRVAAEQNAILHCFDELPGAFSLSEHETVREQMRTAIADDLRSGKNIVCDDVHLTRKRRKEMLDAISGINCEKVLIVINTPLAECLARNAGREIRLPDCILHSCAKSFEYPTVEEGWDSIITIYPRPNRARDFNITN